MADIKQFQDLSLLIISGSTQAGGQSLKVARYLEAYLKHHQIENFLVDLHALKQPFVGLQQDDLSWPERWLPIEKQLSAVDGVVLVSPEYNGGPSPAILNFMLYVFDQLAHKPVLLVGVSAGRGGAYPLAALRQNGFKDPAYVVIPESVIVSRVTEVLNDHNFAGSGKAVLDGADTEVRQHLAQALKMLLVYARALKGVNLLLKP